MTDLSAVPAAALDGLPDDPAALAPVVQGLIVHEFMAEWLYGWQPPPERAGEVETRSAAAIVERILGHDDRPLAEARPVERRMIGNCRTYTTLTCALLRRIGVPARARCGFGTYFEPGEFVDHWVVEHWNNSRGRWVQLDAQLDDIQRANFPIDFDPCDLPPGRFVTGGDAWERCRAGEADPEQFGIMDLRGLWFVRGDVVRDLAALNKVELLPWDSWGLLDEEFDEADGAAVAFVDELALVTVVGDLDRVRKLYETDDRLRVPETVMSARTGQHHRLPELTG
ncbi:MAG: transglutaminase domain-containing protein [Actinomycetota bacterium]